MNTVGVEGRRTLKACMWKEKGLTSISGCPSRVTAGSRSVHVTMSTRRAEGSSIIRSSRTTRQAHGGVGRPTRAMHVRIPEPAK